MDCHGAGGDRSFNSLIPDALDERCEFVVQREWTARHLPPARARDVLERATAQAPAGLAGAPVYDPGAPCTITVELATPDDADKFRNRAGVTLLDARTVECRAARWWDAWRLIYL